MQFLIFAIQHDWLVLLPIVLCSILTVAVAIERYYFYNRNKRDIVQFISRLQRELERGQLENAQILSAQLGGIVGEVAEEGIRVLAEQKESFDRSFDITTTLATRKLLRLLPVLATIATVTPYLGLFATVIRILLTFGELAQQGGAAGAPQIMSGIAAALIATAFGLGIAIVSVALNNYFQTIVNRYEDDFQLLKLLFLSYVDRHEQTAGASAAYAQERRFS
ncbi:MAG: MotA/TolQ/ExbB proton channel family protein [Vampirovibrionales bacterium]|nr:MotA/TolQ/ExbB proton channel family protein [Vampirovibrionales bacterium]